jgi:cytochrome c551/c552
MIRRTLPAMVLGVTLMSVTAGAGGWGVITLRHLPDFVEVGKPLSLAFTVMPHGQQRATGLSGNVEAVSGSQRVSAAITEGQERGLYEATVVLPKAGDWTLTVNAGYRLTLLPIKAIESGSNHAALTAAERGRRLFVAKGCVTCHQNSLATGNPAVNVGPALVADKYQPEFLARMLADPKANIPPRPESPVRMPDLGLQQQEIASLVAFINAGARTAATR